MIYLGYIKKIMERNEKTGEMLFELCSPGKIYSCKCICYPYLNGAPVEIHGKIENGILNASYIRLRDFDRNRTRLYLEEMNIKNLRAASIKKILTNVSTDAFLYIADLSEHDGIPESITRLSKLIAECVYFEKLLTWGMKYGISYHVLRIMYNKHQNKTMEHIMENPFAMLNVGCPVIPCITIAMDNNIHPMNPIWINGMLYNALHTQMSFGNTCIELFDLFDKLFKCEQKAKIPHLSRIFYVEQLIKNPLFILNNIDGKYYASLSYCYENEERIITHILRLKRSLTTYKNDSYIEEIETELGVKYAAEQIPVFNCLSTSGVKILTGGPGTGKTTVLNGIIRQFIRNNPGKKVALCAPTGSAARRMQETTGLPSSTIHKLLNIVPYESMECHKAIRASKIEASLIIADEFSMVDTALSATLLSSVENGSIVLLVGDHEQLPSIGPGQVFRDLLESGVVDVYRLTQNFRQTGNNIILDNAKRILAGELPVEGNGFKILIVPTETDIVETITSMDTADAMVFSPVRKSKFPAGTVNLNRIIGAKVKTSKVSLSFGEYKFYVGSKVIFNDNNYDLGYFNGEHGIITDIQYVYGTYNVTVKKDDGIPICLRGCEELCDIELAYAITAHKAQGTECQKVVIAIPLNPPSMLLNHLLYVEVTRAKQEVIIVSENDALVKAVGHFGKETRITMLKILLNHNL